MNVTIPELDIEQAEALESMRNKYNQSTNSNLTKEEYISYIIIGILNDAKRKAIESAANTLKKAMEALPDSVRLERLERVKSIIFEPL